MPPIYHYAGLAILPHLPPAFNARQLAGLGVVTTDRDITNQELAQLHGQWPDKQIDIIPLASRDAGSEFSAKQLFALLRRLEALPYQAMIAIDISSEDALWPAIKDRLQKARNHWF